jgi:hypothetical protein
MFLVDKPYLSHFFKKTLRDNGIPVVGTVAAAELDLLEGTNIISEEQALSLVKEQPDLPIYSNSENAIGWIATNMGFTSLPEKIELFKDKLKFREMTAPLYAGFFFQGLQLLDFPDFDTSSVPLPCIIKPSVGFFSMGVHKVTEPAEWQQVFSAIADEMKQLKGLYPNEVLGTGSFIIEQCINGEEFAIDAYYDAQGRAVVLGIFHHSFSSDADVSDRVYSTSKTIVEDNIEEFTAFVSRIGEVSGVKNFPVHIELRREADGTLLPIEVNPMRFGGWCSTPDTTALAYGFNPYLYYFTGQRPDWAEILRQKEGKIYSLIVLDNSTGREGKAITAFDYEALCGGFEKVLELRKIDYKRYPVFGFVFTETREGNFAELKAILDSDLSEFVI